MGGLIDRYTQRQQIDGVGVSTRQYWDAIYLELTMNLLFDFAVPVIVLNLGYLYLLFHMVQSANDTDELVKPFPYNVEDRFLRELVESIESGTYLSRRWFTDADGSHDSQCRSGRL